MSHKTVGLLASPLLLTLVLASCGGGSSTPEPMTGNAIAGPEEPLVTPAETGTQTSATSISGRVADGYIRGAVVCVDLNDNEKCDDGEPVAVSGEGGQYTLSVPPEAQMKSIIAEIPADAIDEDTGEPVGQDLVFVTPADKPEFVSPITTLVHEELRNNPNLDVDAAEAIVKGALGLASENDEISLFVDYVANSRPTDGIDAERAEEFQYLHETARVVANLMQDIRSNVETTATENGIDFRGDLATQQAIRELVRSEIKILLPEIAREVAVSIAREETSERGTSEAGDQPEIDHERIAGILFPEDRLADVDGRLETIRDRGEVVFADMKNILSAGLYWFDVDCRAHAMKSDGALTANGDEAELAMLTEGEEYPVQPADNCFAEYGHAVLDASGEQLQHEQYGYNSELAVWEKLERPEDLPADSLALIDGQWLPVLEVGPAGAVTFNSDGSASIVNENGQLNVQASTRDLGGSAVVHHLWQRGSHPELVMSADEIQLFDGEAKMHTLAIQQRMPGIRLFVNPGHDAAACLDYGDNCNVVHSVNEVESKPVTTLDMLRDATINGVDLAGLAHTGSMGESMTVTLKAASNADQTLPQEGTVLWQVLFAVDGEGTMDCAVTDGEPVNIPMLEEETVVQMPDGERPDHPALTEEAPVGPMSGGDVPAGPPPLGEPSDCRLPDGLVPETVEMSADELQGTSPGIPASEFQITSKWRLLEVSGISMFEIEIPLAVRYEFGLEAQESILLVEHSGFVRRGARFAQSRMESEVTYNPLAFDTLKAIVEDFVSSDR